MLLMMVYGNKTDLNGPQSSCYVLPNMTFWKMNLLLSSAAKLGLLTGTSTIRGPAVFVKAQDDG
jgi:hypothetical protein